MIKLFPLIVLDFEGCGKCSLDNSEQFWYSCIVSLSLDYQQRIADLLDLLAHAPILADVANPYAATGSEAAANALRRANLGRALAQARTGKPAMLLVAEAPGYRGARRTGVPFTSDALLLRGVDPPGVFGVQRGFVLAAPDGNISREQTATIVWRELARLKLLAVGWNAFPLHPHRPGIPLSNRTPRTRELRQGLVYLEQVRALFPDLPLVAMGNSAARVLTWLDLPHHKLRHPAQGGAVQFAQGLQALVAAGQLGNN